MTALLDAFGQAVNRIGKQMDSHEKSERREKLSLYTPVWQTKLSLDYDRDKIKEMIEHQKSEYL